MPCGFPGLGIPPLAPMKAEHREVHFNGADFGLDGIVDTFRLDGMDDFDIEEFKINAILSKVTWSFNWKKMICTTEYDMDYNADPNSLVTKVHRKGHAKMTLEGLKIWGTAKYSLGIISGNLRLKEFKLYVSLKSVKSEVDGLMQNKFMNRMINEVIEEFIMLSINDNTNKIAEITNNNVVPIANALIGDLSLTDILGMIGGGGGGGSSGEGGEKEKCIPPESDANGVWAYTFV